jgi:hypothetical protein
MSVVDIFCQDPGFSKLKSRDCNIVDYGLVKERKNNGYRNFFRYCRFYCDLFLQERHPAKFSSINLEKNTLLMREFMRDPVSTSNKSFYLTAQKYSRKTKLLLNLVREYFAGRHYWRFADCLLKKINNF